MDKLEKELNLDYQIKLAELRLVRHRASVAETSHKLNDCFKKFAEQFVNSVRELKGLESYQHV